MLRAMEGGYSNGLDIARVTGMTLERTHAVLGDLLEEGTIMFHQYPEGQWELRNG